MVDSIQAQARIGNLRVTQQYCASLRVRVTNPFHAEIDGDLSFALKLVHSTRTT